MLLRSSSARAALVRTNVTWRSLAESKWRDKARKLWSRVKTNRVEQSERQSRDVSADFPAERARSSTAERTREAARSARQRARDKSERGSLLMSPPHEKRNNTQQVLTNFRRHGGHFQARRTVIAVNANQVRSVTWAIAIELAKEIGGAANQVSAPVSRPFCALVDGPCPDAALISQPASDSGTGQWIRELRRDYVMYTLGFSSLRHFSRLSH